MKAIKKGKYSFQECIFCGRNSPNPYGECGCSYDLRYFQDKKIFRLLKKLGCKVVPATSFFNLEKIGLK